MKIYEFHGSIRVEADTYEQAEDILYAALSDHDLHINDAEEIEQDE